MLGFWANLQLRAVEGLQVKQAIARANTHGMVPGDRKSPPDDGSEKGLTKR